MALSLAIITYNEEENIVRLLDSISDIADNLSDPEKACRAV